MNNIINCTFSGTKITFYNQTGLNLIGSSSSNLSTAFNGSGSNLTVAHYLTINVFEPYGFNSSVFGPLAAGFGYIFPLMNNTFQFGNAQLLAGEFSNANFSNRFAWLRNQVPFGAFNISQSEIPSNRMNAGYGKVMGSKTFIVPDYTLSKNGRINYNPYEIDYTFLAYDQLVMYRLNITKDTVLAPFYIQPIYPSFNWNIIPDNNTREITIKYLIAVPPQDSAWNFTAYLYRYKPTEFVTNPVLQGAGPNSALFKALVFPNKNYTSATNGTLFYFINYTTPISLGLNSSIMTVLGSIPGLGSFVQDSTTPSFSFGVGYCAVADNLISPMNKIMIKNAGTYTMVKRLLPIAEPALPQLVNSACTVGMAISGNGITVNCDNGTINDTQEGILIENSSDVSLSNCNLVGNGIKISNSKGISVRDIRLTPSKANDFAIILNNTQSISFSNVTINNGYRSIISAFSPSGTTFSQGTEFQNLSICGEANLSEVRRFAYVYSSRSSCAGLLTFEIDQDYILGLLTLALLAVYLLEFTEKGRRIEKKFAEEFNRRIK